MASAKPRESANTTVFLFFLLNSPRLPLLLSAPADGAVAIAEVRQGRSGRQCGSRATEDEERLLQFPRKERRGGELARQILTATSMGMMGDGPPGLGFRTWRTLRKTEGASIQSAEEEISINLNKVTEDNDSLQHQTPELRMASQTKFRALEMTARDQS